MLARIRKAQEEREGGFTLIELLVVIIIIGILAAIAIPVFLNQRKKAVDASIKSDLRTAATALETYFTDNQAYNAATGQSPKFSQGNTIKVAVTATGYCLQGQNANSDTGTTTVLLVRLDRWRSADRRPDGHLAVGRRGCDLHRCRHLHRGELT